MASYNEVVTKSNFYFAVDETKQSRNLKLSDPMAPGNPVNKPKYILGHEHINVSNYIDVEDLNEDRLFEIYGYYSYLIDMHIAQIRPENLDEISYVPARFN